jgi:thermostable 8-oxoguanine DNA glycosylase
MFPKLSSVDLVRKLESTLISNGVDIEINITELDQVNKFARRKRGENFAFDEHVKGVILALLSNQRPWKPILLNLNKITNIFFGFDSQKIKLAPKDSFVKQLKEIKCGNRAIAKQMECLDYNINVLEKITIDYGSLDSFINSDTPDRIAIELGQGTKYKLKQLGYTLALEYLRNVGVEAIKPDLHVRRIISNQRLNFHESYPSERETVEILSSIAQDSGVTLTYLDNLIWMYCAVDYGNICGSTPKCHLCELQKNCNGGVQDNGRTK